MLKRLSVLFSLMALVIAAPAGAQQPPIKIGAILPLTGSGASYGVWMKGGAEMATEEINAAGGIGGRKLEVIYEDHAADASKAVNGMRRLVEVEKVPFTLTSYSAPTLAIQPIGAQNKVVMMNGGGQSDNLANKDYLYNNIPVVSNEVGVLADWLTKEKKFKAAGGDLLFISSYGRNVPIIADQAREIGVTLPMAATSWILIPDVYKSKGAEGMLVTRLPFNPDSPFARKFKDRYKTDAGFFAVQYYSGTKIFARAAEEAMKKSGGKLDGEGVKNAIESLKAFDTISGKLVFQPNHAAVMDIEVGVLKGGKVEVEKTLKANP